MTKQPSQPAEVKEPEAPVVEAPAEAPLTIQDVSQITPAKTEFDSGVITYRGKTKVQTF